MSFWEGLLGGGHHGERGYEFMGGTAGAIGPTKVMAAVLRLAP